MRNFKPVDDNEINEIEATLGEAALRRGAEDLLHGFPWESTDWFSAELEDRDFERLFLFWDGSAWAEDPCHPPKRLAKGLEDFIELAKRSPDQWTCHLQEIVRIKDSLRDEEAVEHQPILILIGKDQGSPLMILDGNHRAVAMLWRAHEGGMRENLPTRVWVGFSPEMTSYPWYRCEGGVHANHPTPPQERH